MAGKVKGVFWTNRSKSDVQKTISFYKKLYGKERTKKLISSAVQAVEDLENGITKRGAIDDGMSHLKRTYRKLVINHIRVSYREGKDKIYIVRFFDTRQHPNKQK